MPVSKLDLAVLQAASAPPTEEAKAPTEEEQAVQAERPTLLRSTLERLGEVGRAGGEAISETMLESETFGMPEAGAMVGGMAGLTRGGIPGLVGGAFAGSAAMEAARQSIVGDEIDPEEVAWRSAKNAALELFGEGAGRLVLSPLLNRFLRGAPKGTKARGGLYGRVAAGAVEADAYLRGLAKQHRDGLISGGMHPKDAELLTLRAFEASQMTQSRFLDMLRSSSEGSFTSNRLQRLDDAVDELVDVATHDYVRAIGRHMDPDQTATLLRQSLDEVLAPERARIGALHDEIATEVDAFFIQSRKQPLKTKEGKSLVVRGKDGVAAKAGVVDLRPVRKSLDEMLGALERDIGHLPIDPEGITRVQRLAASLPDEASFEAVRQLRTALDDLTAGFPASGKETALKAATTVREALTGRMRDALRAYDKANRLTGSKSMSHKWTIANRETQRFYSERKTKFVSEMISMIAREKKGAQAIGKILEKQTAFRLRALRETLGKDSPAWEQLKRWKLEEMFGSPGADPRALRGGSMRGGVGRQVEGANMVEALDEEVHTSFGRAMSKTLFGDELHKELVDLGHALGTRQKAMRSNTGGMWILRGIEVVSALATVGGAAHKTRDFLADENTGGGATAGGSAALLGGVLLSSALLSRHLTNPKTVKAIRRGVRTGWKSRESLAALARMMADAGQDEVASVPNAASPEEYAAMRQAGF